MSTPSKSAAEKAAEKKAADQAAADAKASAEAASAATAKQAEQDATAARVAEEKAAEGKPGDQAAAAAKAAEAEKTAEENGGNRNAGDDAANEAAARFAASGAQDGPASGPLEPTAPTWPEPPIGEDHREDHGEDGGPREEEEPAKHEGSYLDADDRPLSYSDLFDDSDGTKTFVVVKTRAYEEFPIPNTKRTGKRLAFNVGTKISRQEAALVKERIEG